MSNRLSTSAQNIQLQVKRIIRLLNNLWIFYEFSRDTLGAALDAEDDTTCAGDYDEIEFAVPSINDHSLDSNITRSVEETGKLNAHYSSTGLNRMVLIYMVSLYEAFIARSVRIRIQGDNKLLKVSIKGNDGNKTISFEDILELKDKEAIINRMIDDRIMSLLYAKPGDQLKYLSSIFRNNAINSIGLGYIEIKATRDILVHNAALVNSLYIEKAGELARAEIGKGIIVDSDYLRSSVSIMKRLSLAMKSKLK